MNMTSPPMAKAHAEHVRQLEMQAGDCVVFSEATTHGALPWSAAHERRSLIVRYCPGNNAAAGPDWKWPMDWPAEWLEGMGSHGRPGHFHAPCLFCMQRH